MSTVRSLAEDGLREELKNAKLPIDPAALIGRKFKFTACLLDQGDGEHMHGAHFHLLDQEDFTEQEMENLEGDLEGFQIFGTIRGFSYAGVSNTCLHIDALDTRIGLIRSIRIEGSTQSQYNACICPLPGGEYRPSDDNLTVTGIPGELLLLD